MSKVSSSAAIRTDQGDRFADQTVRVAAAVVLFIPSYAPFRREGPDGSAVGRVVNKAGSWG